MKYVNLTAHTINEVTSGMSIPTSGRVCRVKATTVKIKEHVGIPLYSTEFGEVEGLPEPVTGVMYIVSALALNAIDSSRTDCVAPGNLQRNENGQPVGCVGFRLKD